MAYAAQPVEGKVHTEILAPAHLEILGKIGDAGGIPFYLSGGTAEALHLGHRKSLNLGFFCQEAFDEEELNRKCIKLLPGFSRNHQAPQILLGTWKQVSVSFSQYRHPNITPLIATPWKVGLSGLEDIATMKLEAIGGRESRIDFVDLYFLVKAQFTLEQVFSFLSRKYTGVDYDPYDRLRNLSYFEKADQQPMPEMILPADWSAIKTFFSSEIRRLWGSPLS